MRVYILYDERAIGAPVDRLDNKSYLELCYSLTEAKGSAPEYGSCVCVSYAGSHHGGLLSDPQEEFIYRGGCIEESFL